MLKFARDRHRWLYWLYQARKSYGLTILNYTVTSNHIHLLVADDRDRGVIPKSVKLVAGRTGQEFAIGERALVLKEIRIEMGSGHDNGLIYLDKG